jgi:hypothetical protein
MNFKVDSVSANGLTDLSKSYCIFSVDVNSTDYKKDGTTAIQGVVNPWRWGNSGVKYNGTSLIRNVRLDSNKGCLENIIQQNVLSQTLNINYLSSKSEQKSQDILNFYSGATHDESGLFNSSPWINYNSNGTPTSPTDYATASMILPLKETALGIAKVGAVDLNELEHENLALRFELEDQYNTLDLAWESVADFKNTTGSPAYGKNRTLVWNEQLNASYNQTVGQNPVYQLTVDKRVNWLNTTDGSQSAFPFASAYAPTVNAGFINITYTDASLVQQNIIVPFTGIQVGQTNNTLTLTAALPGANIVAGGGGLTAISVVSPVQGVIQTTTLNQITVNVPHPKNALNNCPFTVNQSICIWGNGLDVSSQGETYKITAIARTAPTSATTGGSNYVDTYVLTLDSATNIGQNTYANIYLAPSEQATATWAISQPQFTLATFNETPDMKTRRSNKMAGVKTSFMSWELESFTWGTNQTSYMRQWVLNPSTVSALLCTPLPNTLVSVRDNCNQVRIILNSKQLTNRPLLIDANTSAGSQFTDWVKDVLKHYCGLDVKQLQQIPRDAPGSVMMVPCPIEDLRFTSSTEQRTSPHILEVQLFSPSTATMNAKTFYLFKNVVKHL